MEYIEINGQRYLATTETVIDFGEFYGKRVCTVHLNEMSFDEARELFQDGITWSRVVTWTVIEEGVPVEKETVELMVGVDIIDKLILNRDDTTSVVIRELSDLEQAYELLYGGIN